MDDSVRAELFRSQIIDLTTTGRRTGRRRRIEIFLHEKDGILFISGMPRADRTRDWIYNVAADPRVVVHLKQSVVADVPATARVVTDPDERQPLIDAAAQRWGRTDIPAMLAAQPTHRAPRRRRRSGSSRRRLTVRTTSPTVRDQRSTATT